MSIRSRLAGLALAAAAVASMGLAVVPAASAAPAAHHAASATKFFGLHLRLHDAGVPAYPASLNCYRYHRFSNPNSTCNIQYAGRFDGGHAGPDAGFAGHAASISYGPDGDTTYLSLTTPDGQYFVKGHVPGRGSGDFTVDSINVPGTFGKVVGENKLALRVDYEGPGLTGDAWQDFYLTGDLKVEPSGVGAPTNPFAGLFGSS